jgi:hypothetical protein
VTDLIDYSLVLPATKLGERLAKTVGRILKHTYQAKRLRIQHSKDSLLVNARVDRMNLEAIRAAVNMTLMARGVEAKLHKGSAKEYEECTVEVADGPPAA